MIVRNKVFSDEIFGGILWRLSAWHSKFMFQVLYEEVMSWLRQIILSNRKNNLFVSLVLDKAGEGSDWCVKSL